MTSFGATERRRISSTSLPGVTVMIGYPCPARCRQQAAVYIPPTQLPSAKQITAREVRSSARKLSRNTCSNRAVTAASSATDRSQTAGTPDEPDETATRSQRSSRPSRHSSGSGYRRW